MDAVVCNYCGKPFKSASEDYSTTKDVDQKTRFLSKDLEEKIQNVNVEAPSEGIAIFVFGPLQPIEIRVENEFFIGRLTESTEEKVVDLTPYNAFTLGVSRRHLMVRRVGDGYEVMDLDSTNGTWVNEQRLEPQHPFTLISGSHIRLGNMRIFVSFHQKISKP